MENIKIVLEEYIKANHPNLNLIIDIRENKDKSKGDYYTTLAFILVKHIVNKTPYEIGISIKVEIENKLKNYEVVIAQTGHINFVLRREGYMDILKNIENIDFSKKYIEVFNMDNFDIEKIKYVYNRIKTIFDILKIENITVDINKFNEDNMDILEQGILTKLIYLIRDIDKYNYNEILLKIEDLCNCIYKYEEFVIIRYLPMNRLENLIILLEGISMLIKKCIKQI